jgi:hypothetical protein
MDNINQQVERLSEILYDNFTKGNFAKEKIFGCSDNSTQLNIDAKVLKDCGFDVDNKNGIFFNLICPKLKREGLLETFSQSVLHPLGDLSGNNTYVFFAINPKNLKGSLKGIGEKAKDALNDKKVDFDDNGATIKIGDKSVSLPPYKNEHFLCRAIFEHKKGEPVDWSIIYEKMEESEPSNKVKNKRRVYDATEALNNRIKEILNTNDDFLTFKEKTITRNY